MLISIACLAFASAIKVLPNIAASRVVVKPPIPADKKEELVAMLALAGKLQKLKLLAEAAQTLKAKTEVATNQEV